MTSKENNSSILLDVNNIEVIYNHVILVLRGVSLAVPKGGIVALLGGNGAGKTTTLKAVSNLLHSERGEVTKGYISYRGAEIHGADPADMVKRGVIQVMEGRHCFEHLTVEENLLTGAYTRSDSKANILKYTTLSHDYNIESIIDIDPSQYPLITDGTEILIFLVLEFQFYIKPFTAIKLNVICTSPPDSQL